MRMTLLTLLSITLGTPAWADDAVEFSRDVRPILSETCFFCHGPDGNERQADLRLDVEDGLYREHDGGAIVVPGRPDESLLYQRITAEDEYERMPPADSGKSLTPDQIAVIRRWIEQGAKWQGHWAYIPPTKPPVPEVGHSEFVRNEIDAFILSRLQGQDGQPSPMADRPTLIRRLSFDIRGLPPTSSEIADFVADSRPDAYERVVDRFLQSPQFGERLAQYWLDVVRFADTNGIHGDNHRDVDLFRDYVIDALNENRPFDQFTIEQLAGDLLPDRTSESLVASGYNRLLMTTREGGAQPKEYLAKYAADRVRNASSAWLGSTMACCECHDHKYDPFTAKDFYRFEAFFADIKETAVGVQEPTRIPSPEQQAQIERLNAQLAPLRQTLDTQTPELDAAQAAWEQDLSQRDEAWTILLPAAARAESGMTLTIEEDGTVFAEGEAADKDIYELTFETSLAGITALKLEVLPDDRLPEKGPGKAGNGNFVINEVTLHSHGEPAEISAATATHSQKDWDIAGAIDGKPKTGWAILDQTGKANHAILELATDLGPAGETEFTQLKLRLTQHHGGRHALGRFRISVTKQSRPVRVDALPKDIQQIVAVAPAGRSESQQRRLAEYYRSISPLLAETRQQIAQIQAQITAVENAMPTMLVSMSVEPRTMRVLPRGNWLDDSGEVVEPGVPEFLGSLGIEDRRATRLDLARWLVSPENPLVARVFVNRLWQLNFGRGLVATAEDFGSQGAWPSHPRLLDWLAVEFINSGWDIKHMVRLMVTSGTYRQSSFADAETRQWDPFNQWLARQSRFRLDAEMVRDNALLVSGLLSTKMGGPSVKPYQPKGYWSHLNFPKREYEADAGEDLYRRGVYTYWCRTFLHPSLLAFDAPTREECTVSRPRSNTPLQALVLLNDPIYVEAARKFAERILREGRGDVESRISFAFEQALARTPHSDESALLRTLYEDHLQQYRQERHAAEDLISIGESSVPTDLAPAELAAWTSVARAIFNLHEFITRN